MVVKNEGASRGHGNKLYFSFFLVSHVARFEVRPGVTVCKVNLNVLIGCGGFWETERKQWCWETPQLCYLSERERKIEGRILKPVYTLWILPQVCNWANSTIAFVKNLNCTFYLEETIFFTCISFFIYIEFDSTILYFVTELLTMYSWIDFNLRDKNLSGFMNISFICVFLRWTNTYGLGMMWGWKIIFTV